MSSFREDITKVIIDTMQEEGVLCAKYHLMSESWQEGVKDSLFSALKKVMEINEYEV